jgi:Tfp pilus assembly protein PilF
LEGIHGSALASLRARSFESTDAWTAYRIGESFNRNGNVMKALSYFERAFELAPLNSEFANKYATALAAGNQADKAIQILQASVAEYPKHAPTHSNLGYLLLTSQGDTASARRHYDIALHLDPDYEQANLNKAGLLMLRGRKREALNLLRDFMKRKPESTKAVELLNMLNGAS